MLIDQGTYNFILANGAKFTVYASPWTPAYGFWGFQYDEVDEGILDNTGGGGGEAGGNSTSDDHRQRHSFADLLPGTDLAMTHGPPYGILDTTTRQVRAGCRMLRECVRQARPRVHCFGHIHEAAGYAVATWNSTKRGDKEAGDLLTDEVVEHVSEPGKGLLRQLSLSKGDSGDIGLENGRQTLFINAAVMDTRLRPYQSPWVLDLDLVAPDEEHKRKAENTGRLLEALKTTESV